jgi:2,3-bisphosphoglycerate-dependent phosphoglycerate mutase
VRHGQSQAYRDGTLFPLVDGHGDPPLSPLGEVQAELVGARLSALDVDAIYVSTLRRTAQTAAPLAAELGLPVRVEADLREVYLGEWEGGVFRQMMADSGPVAQQVRAQERWDAIPGAESNEALAGRVRAAIERIAAAHPDQRVAAFTHGGVISQVLALATRSRPFAFLGADNASISQLVITDEFWFVRGFNDIAHLEAAQLPAGAPE